MYFAIDLIISFLSGFAIGVYFKPNILVVMKKVGITY